MTDNARGRVHIFLNQRASTCRSIAVRAHQFLNIFSSTVVLKALGWQSGHLNQDLKAQKELHVFAIFIAWMAHVGRGTRGTNQDLSSCDPKISTKWGLNSSSKYFYQTLGAYW